jgi:hypothetical protein
MSSTAAMHEDAGRHADPVPLRAVPDLDVDQLAELEAEGREQDRGFGRAIAVGSIAGIAVFIVALAAVVKIVAPELTAAAIAGIAVWTGVWAGLFLGGTLAVGRWSMRNHH